jgi:hypothetical protein
MDWTMHRQRLIPYLTAICFCTVFPICASEPQGQFWIIRAANEIAVPLVEAVEGKNLPTAELTSRITGSIDAKKVQQLARFDQVLGEGQILPSFAHPHS